MKRLISLFLAAVLLLSFAGCNKKDKYKDVDMQELADIEQSGAKEYKSPVLIILGDGNDIFGITQCGNLVIVDNPDEEKLRSGMVVAMMDIKVDDDGTRSGTFTRPFTQTYQRPVYAETNNAPKTCVVMLLENAINNGTNAALEDYKIVKVTRDGFYGDHINEGAGIVDCTVLADIKPARNITYYGNVGEDGWVRNKEFKFTIWGAAKTWFLKSENPIESTYSDYTTSGTIGESKVLHVTDDMLYQYACLGAEDDVRTYNFEKEYDADEDYDYAENETAAFYTSLFALNGKDEMEVYLEKLPNILFNFADYYEKKLYLSSVFYSGEIETRGDIFGYIDQADKKYHKILEKGSVFGTQGEKIYVLGKINDDSEQLLHCIDIKTGKIVWSHKLPYEIPSINNVTLSRIKDGYIHIYYGEYNEAYKVSIVDGSYSFAVSN